MMEDGGKGTPIVARRSTPRVVIESPYSSPSRHIYIRHTLYLKECILDSIARGEAPLAGHLFYTQVLNDRDTGARALGIRLMKVWARQADLIAVYTDRGISHGMQIGIDYARKWAIPIEYRSIK